MLSANRVDLFIGHEVVFLLFEKTSCCIILVFGGERRGRDRVLLTQSKYCVAKKLDSLSTNMKKKAVPSASLVFTVHFPE